MTSTEKRMITLTIENCSYCPYYRKYYDEDNDDRDVWCEYSDTFISKMDSWNCEKGFPEIYNLVESSKYRHLKSYELTVKEKCECCYVSSGGYHED